MNLHNIEIQGNKKNEVSCLNLVIENKTNKIIYSVREQDDTFPYNEYDDKIRIIKEEVSFE